MAAHYFWVMRMQEVSFEEASIAPPKNAPRIIAAGAGRHVPDRIREGQGAPRSVPPRRHRPARARVSLEKPAFHAARISTSAPSPSRRRSSSSGADGSQRDAARSAGTCISIIAGISLSIGAYIMLLGPQLARQDLRSDLTNADILKTYPLRGWQVVLGEMLTPIAILTGLLWLALSHRSRWLSSRPAAWYNCLRPGLRIACAPGPGRSRTALLALQLLVLNGATADFPGLVSNHARPRRRHRGHGTAADFFPRQLLVILTALLPSAAGGWPDDGRRLRTADGCITCLAATRPVHDRSRTGPAVVAAMAVLVIEVWFGLWLARRTV